MNISLQDIILDLKLESKDNPFYGTRLFHSVDYFEDCGNLWLDRQKCSGGSCCVFTYYEDAPNKVSTMIKGMGRMIANKWNLDFAAELFTTPHFRASKGYKWHTNIRKFSSPQIRHMKLNKKHEPN